jgi:glucose/arabinose dehydrogenase
VSTVKKSEWRKKDLSKLSKSKFMKTFFTLVLLITSLSAYGKYKAEVLLTQNDVIWGFDFLPDGKILFNERGGNLYLFDPKSKKKSLISGNPKVHAAGQGGLLDVRVHPKTGMIYLAYSEPTVEKKFTTALGMAKLQGNKLVEFKKIFSAQESSLNEHHYGSRIDFDGKGHLFISVGERGEEKSVQRLDTHLGKIIRIHEDGSVPKNNPFVTNKKALPEIWCYGLRNPQGLAIRPGTDELWEAEMGPQGGDEINLILPGKNYGWPIITWGKDYDGDKIGIGTHKAGMEQPIEYWIPSISPSGMTFYSGDKMPEWKGNIFLALLSGQHLRRLVIEDKKVVKQEEIFKELNWRFRNVRTGPDGYLYFSTDEGKLGRVIGQ